VVSLDKAVIARLETHGEHFELLVDPELAFKMQQGDEVELEELLATHKVFKDAKKGEKASPENVNNVLGTESFEEAVGEIIKRGEIQLTTELRKKLIERKRKRVVDFIVRNSINPQTNSPHPPHRIERAMEEAKVHINLGKRFEDQANEVIKKLKPLIPLKFEKRKVAIKIPPQYAGKTYPHIQRYGEVREEEWLNDGSYACLLSLPAGMVEELFDELNALTKGEVETKIL